ncbi:hypothetical protein OF83DRAFT_73157 [Amylostereum chailletii]|nr:hypothetical protein OF83DRAFT_73157 [Amylostereum chailletii]
MWIGKRALQLRTSSPPPRSARRVAPRHISPGHERRAYGPVSQQGQKQTGPIDTTRGASPTPEPNPKLGTITRALLHAGAGAQGFFSLHAKPSTRPARSRHVVPRDSASRQRVNAGENLTHFHFRHGLRCSGHWPRQSGFAQVRAGRGLPS